MNMEKEIREAVLYSIEESLKAQLKAIKKLRGKKENEIEEPKRRRITQIGMIEDVLREEGGKLHINEIITRVQNKYGISLNRDSIVSAIIKRIQQGKTFRRCGPNTFGLEDGKR